LGGRSRIRIPVLRVSEDCTPVFEGFADGELLAELVYALIQLVPVGCVTTYGDVAEVLGIPPRLVGSILKRNKNPVAVPCHRVVGRRSLGGYTLGGRRADHLKKRLIELESGGELCRFSVKEFLLSRVSE